MKPSRMRAVGGNGTLYSKRTSHLEEFKDYNKVGWAILSGHLWTKQGGRKIGSGEIGPGEMGAGVIGAGEIEGRVK